MKYELGAKDSRQVNDVFNKDMKRFDPLKTISSQKNSVAVDVKRHLTHFVRDYIELTNRLQLRVKVGVLRRSL